MNEEKSLINASGLLDEMLLFMSNNEASDLHISAGSCPYVRIHGKIFGTNFPALTQEQCEELMFSIMSAEERDEFLRIKTLDFSFAMERIGYFRVNVYQQRGQMAVAVRLLPPRIPTIEELGLPVEPVQRFCNLSRGLVLICGPVGSGKTTTLAAMINYINHTRNTHIITIEDPIEYVHRNNKSLIHQREVRRDTPNFADALRYILREDPDIVVVGEMRDLETISAAVTIAETGHLVLATLHTGDAAESIRRIIDVFPAGQQQQIIAQLSYTLAGVINQVLLPNIEDNGRVLASEVMISNSAIQNLIRENRAEQVYSIMQLGSKEGMHTMNQSLSDLVRQGKIARDMAMGKSTKTKELLKLLEH
jgi:twitching motility protein PilT